MNNIIIYATVVVAGLFVLELLFWVARSVLG